MTRSRARLAALFTSASALIALPLALNAPVASAAPSSYSVSTASAGVASAGELALDQSRDELFITDNNARAMSSGGSNFSFSKYPVKPKVTVFSIKSRKVVRSIDLSDQPLGMMLFGPVPLLPVEQSPDGIAIDPKRGRVIVTNAHANGVTSFNMSARRVTPANLLSLPSTHPMGVLANAATGRTYVALNNADKVLILNTSTGRSIGEIGGIYHPSFLDVDNSRHRLYVGNADYIDKKQNFVAVVDTRTNRVIKKITTPSNSRVKVNPVTGDVWANSYDTGKISVIDSNTLQIKRTIETNTTPNKLVFDATRRLAYTANLQKRTVTVLDASSGAILRVIPTGAPVHTIVVDDRTGIVYGTQHMGGNLTIITPKG